MRVLVTGSDGYIGSVLVPILEDAGFDVTGWDSRWFSECVFGPQSSDPVPNPIDIRDLSNHSLDGFDAVVHLAALSNDPLGALAEQDTYDINHLASVSLARLAKDSGVKRFVYSSTCSVYGAADPSLAVNENSPMSPVTAYAKSKVAVEGDLSKMASEDFCPIFLRNATAYGVSPRLRTDLVLNNLVAWAYLTGSIKVLSDGTPWRPLVHVRDISAAALSVLSAPEVGVRAQAFNIGHENFQVREIASIVANQFPGCEVEITGDSGSDPRSYRVDFSKAQRLLPDLKFAWTVESGAAELARFYRSYGLTMEQMTLNFARLPWLTKLRDEGKLGSDFRWKNT